MLATKGLMVDTWTVPDMRFAKVSVIISWDSYVGRRQSEIMV